LPKAVKIEARNKNPAVYALLTAHGIACFFGRAPPMGRAEELEAILL
jgi:hypothetical protein